MQKIRETTAKKVSEEKAAIFDAHITLLEDEDLLQEVNDIINDEKVSADYALSRGIEVYRQILSDVQDEYLRERAGDLADIADRWIRNLLGEKILELSEVPENSIIVARDLTPSDTANLNLENTLGFITEIGGTTGDIESQPFLEAIRQVGLEVGRENSLYIHVTLVPFLRGSDEHKTKPTQHSVKELQGMGINPNIIVLRCDEPLEDNIFKKISLFCNVKPDCVIENMTIPVLYEAPIMLEKNHFSDIVCRELGINTVEPDLTDWNEMLERIKNRNKKVTIGLVGKYVQLHDAYLSVAEALRHAGYVYGARVQIKWIDSETVNDKNAAETLAGCDGILVPGGFGNRGIEGMISTARYARTHNVPYLGICLGMQIAVIEFARSVLGLNDANSGEFDENSNHKVIDFMPDQNSEINKGGTMRLGAYPCKIAAGTKMAECYKADEIKERHRHRYEFNNDYRSDMTANGLVISGTSPDNHIVETVEVPENDFYVGVQFHPEFKSRPNKAHPLFMGLVKAGLDKQMRNS